MNNNSNIKRFQLLVSVDINTLVESYRDNTDVREDEDLPSVEDLILFSTNWMNADGVATIKVKEVEE